MGTMGWMDRGRSYGIKKGRSLGKEGRTQVGSVERGVKDKERIKDV